MNAPQAPIAVALLLAACGSPMLGADSDPQPDLRHEVAKFLVGDEDMFGFDEVADLEASLTLGPVHPRLVPTDAFYQGTVADASGLEADLEAFVVVYQHGVATNVVQVSSVEPGAPPSEATEVGPPPAYLHLLAALGSSERLVTAWWGPAMFYAWDAQTGLVRPLVTTADWPLSESRPLAEFAKLVSDAYLEQNPPGASPSDADGSTDWIMGGR